MLSILCCTNGPRANAANRAIVFRKIRVIRCKLMLIMGMSLSQFAAARLSGKSYEGAHKCFSDRPPAAAVAAPRSATGAWICVRASHEAWNDLLRESRGPSPEQQGCRTRVLASHEATITTMSKGLPYFAKAQRFRGLELPHVEGLL
jgi:hypothetical protein